MRPDQRDSSKAATKPDVRHAILSRETAILGALCQGATDGSVWETGTALLARYHWQDVEHELVFQTLREIKSSDPEVIHQELPRRLTRKGFPDVDLDALFEPHTLTVREAMALLRALAATADREQTTPPPLGQDRL